MAKRFRVSRTIDAPIQMVWGLLTDTSGYTIWNPAIVSLEGTIAPGETISLVSTVNPKRTFKLKVTEMTAPHRMVCSSGMPLGLFSGVRTYALTEQGGVTEFQMTEEYSGALADLITRSIPDMSDSFDQFADGLKMAAEGSNA
jgi:uncharacterized protein YndB with AHSA1/START domain